MHGTDHLSSRGSLTGATLLLLFLYFVFPPLFCSFSMIGLSLPQISLLEFELVPENVSFPSTGSKEETKHY